MDETPELAKGGLVRRGVALAIDLIVVEIVLQLLAAMIFPISGGVLIDSNGVYTSCETAEDRPSGIAIPPGFQPTSASICTKSLFGWPTALLYTVSHQDPGTHLTTTLSFAIGRDHELVKVFDLAAFQGIVLVAMRWLLERQGLRSLGRKWLSLTVRPRWGDRGQTAFRAALGRRYLMCACPLIPGLLLGILVFTVERRGGSVSGDLLLVLTFLGNLPVSVTLLAGVAAIARGRDAFYDESAGTTVARIVDGEVLVAAQRSPRSWIGRIAAAGAGHHHTWVFPWATCALSACLAAVYVGELAASHGTGVTGFTLVLFGGMDAELVRQIGQTYRLLTAIFIHASMPHLLANVAVLLLAGTLLEGVFGRSWFVATFLLGGLAASLASISANPPALLSVGASGAVAAILAAGLVSSYGLADAGRRLWIRAFCTACLLAALQASGKFAWGTIDRADHVGGAIAGTVLGLIMLSLWRAEKLRPSFGRAAVVTAVALAALLFASVPRAGFGDVPIAALLIPAGQLPQNDAEWTARSADLVRQFPSDPRAHLARAVAVGDDPEAREREIDRVLEFTRRFAPADVPAAAQNALLVVGAARQNARDWQTARALFTRAIETTAPTKPNAFALRAEAEHALGEFDAALADLRRLSSLQPPTAATHINIADLLFDQGQERDAIEELDQALTLAPDNPAALRLRGWIEFYAKRNDDAERDLRRALQLDPKDAYAALWLDVVSMRAGHGDHLRTASQDLDTHGWPGPVIEFYLGEIDVDALMSDAADSDAGKQGDQRCEANFYAGEWQIMHGSQTGAAPFLKQAAADCPQTFVERAASKAELSGAAGYRMQ